MSLFGPAENGQGYAKISLMGYPGSGKTFTAMRIATGLVAMSKSDKPVYALDSEGGFSYLVDHFKAANVELNVARTRAFVDLSAAIDDAEKNASVLIVDSVTHYWQDILSSFLKKNNRKQTRLSDWSEIKGTWNKEFTTKFLNSPVHVILCGRATDDLESIMNDEGRLEVHKIGSRMAAEKNLGFEPGLVIEMERVSLGPPQRGKRNFCNRAYVLKDRFDAIDGQCFDDPTFENFLPHISKLNIGHHAVISSKDSTEMFEPGSDRNYGERLKQVKICMEEIQNTLLSAYPGRGADEVKAKTDIINNIFGTRSWTALEDLDPKRLQAGLIGIKNVIAGVTSNV